MPDYRITVDIKDVADGDIQHFVENLEKYHGPDFDIDRGDFAVSVSKREGSSYFPHEITSE